MRQRPWHGWLASVKGASQFHGTVEPFARQVRLPLGVTRNLVSIRCLPRLGFTSRPLVPELPQEFVFDTRFNNRLTVEPVITLLPSLRRKHTDPIYFFQHRVTNAFPLGRTFDFKVEYRFRSAS